MNIQHFKTNHRLIITLLLLCVTLGLSLGCQRSPNQVTIEVDQQTKTEIATYSPTVRDVLDEQGIILSKLDRVEPDLYVTIKPEMTIRVIRITQTTSHITNTIPFQQRVVINEALAEGEQRLVQLGVNGIEEIITEITYENGVEVNREQLSSTILQQPIEEILVVGSQGTLSTVYFEGIIAYLSGGNVWMMKNNSAARRALTTQGDLDGRVFSLAPNGNTLLYSRMVTDVIDAPLNELWTIDTRIVGEEAISLPIKGILYADWVPHITKTLIAYSTAERVASQPGWLAHNDLWLWDITTEISKAVEIIPANTNGLYPWWGTSFAVAPDGYTFAYANANEVGIVDVISKTVTALVEFAPYQTNSEWVWVPTISWSPNSKFIATVLHGPPLESAYSETSQSFDVWFLAADGSFKAKIWEEAGMWSNPVWYTDGVSFGRAVDPLRSINSRYKLATVDWDGSNPQVLFPLNREIGLEFLEMVWHPNGNSAVFVYANNLHLLTKNQSLSQQLTSDNQSHQPKWVIPTIKDINITKTLTISKVISSTFLLAP